MLFRSVQQENMLAAGQRSRAVGDYRALVNELLQRKVVTKNA